MSLEKALDLLARTHQESEAAKRQVWTAIQGEHPQVAAAVAAMGFSEESLLRWLCESKDRNGQSPAALIASGQGDRVILLAKRAEHGFF